MWVRWRQARAVAGRRSTTQPNHLSVLISSDTSYHECDSVKKDKLVRSWFIESGSADETGTCPSQLWSCYGGSSYRCDETETIISIERQENKCVWYCAWCKLKQREWMKMCLVTYRLWEQTASPLQYVWCEQGLWMWNWEFICCMHCLTLLVYLRRNFLCVLMTVWFEFLLILECTLLGCTFMLYLLYIINYYQFFLMRLSI
jgi:hypothetical protein